MTKLAGRGQQVQQQVRAKHSHSIFSCVTTFQGRMFICSQNFFLYQAQTGDATQRTTHSRDAIDGCAKEGPILQCTLTWNACGTLSIRHNQNSVRMEMDSLFFTGFSPCLNLEPDFTNDPYFLLAKQNRLPRARPPSRTTANGYSQTFHCVLLYFFLLLR